MNTIATPYQLRARLGIAPETDDLRLAWALGAAAAALERHTGRRFTPRRAVVPHPVNPNQPTLLILHDDLLALHALSDAAGPVDVGDVALLPGGPSSASVLALVGGRALLWGDSTQDAVSVDATWGWHDRWDLAWADTGVSLAAPAAPGDSTLSLDDSAALDPQGAPWLQVGGLLRLGTEMLDVQAINAEADTLTVCRGANGSTAGDHAAGATLERYQPPADVADLVLRWAGWLYREPDADFSLLGTAGPPATLTDALRPLRRLRV